MPIRRVLLRVMLWCLGIAAAMGVLAVLLSWDDTAWKIVGTVATTAVAAGLLMAASIRAEKKKFQMAGSVAMGLILAEWLLALLMIWEVPRMLSGGGGWWFERRYVVTLFALLGPGTWAVIGLAMVSVPPMKMAGRFTTGVAIATGVLMLLATWSGDRDHLYETAGAVAGIGAIATLVLLGTTFRRPIVFAGLVACLASFVLIMGSIWLRLKGDNGVFETILSIGIVCGYVQLIRLIPLPQSAEWLRKALYAAAIVCAVTADIHVILDYPYGNMDIFGRIAGAAAIIAGCGTLALVILSRMRRPEIPVGEVPAVEAISLTCPICSKKVTGPPGDLTCGHCRMGFHVALKEPRCPACGYLLLMLRTDRCPECGAAVAPMPQSDTDKALDAGHDGTATNSDVLAGH